jgi:hypothetical protein
MCRACSTHRMRTTHRILVAKPGGHTPLKGLDVGGKMIIIKQILEK